MRRVCGALVAALLVSASPQAQTPPPRPPEDPALITPKTKFSEADEALHLQRFEALSRAARSGAGLDAYDPLEPVGGAAKVTAMPRATNPSISPAALAQASDYAGRSNANAFIVWRDGQIQTEAYFRGANADTLVVSRSLAKPMTAVAIGRAIMLGKIKSLDQPVADFITEWKGKPQEKMLIRHLLDMRTGFLPQDIAMHPQHILNRAYLHPRHDEIIINDYPLTHEPGTRYEYSNATSEMVAPVIERATGMRYSQFLAREVLSKIGAPGGSVWVNRPGGMAHSGCCLLLPAQSWLRLGVLLLQDGVWNGQRLLPRGYVKEMRTPTPQYAYSGMGVYVAGRYIERRGFANPERNVGKSLHSEPYLAADLFLMDGNANQVVYMIPSERMVILRTGSPPPRQPEWDNAMLPNLLMRGIVRRPGEKAPDPQPR
jgi:CubicO group peptidase (beta-lactamase class C family)